MGACAQTGVAIESIAAMIAAFRRYFIFDLWLGDYVYSLLPRTIGSISDYLNALRLIGLSTVLRSAEVAGGLDTREIRPADVANPNPRSA
jgi:hypothetical protein